MKSAFATVPVEVRLKDQASSLGRITRRPPSALRADYGHDSFKRGKLLFQGRFGVVPDLARCATASA